VACRIAVIGAGPGGYTAAIRAAQLGAEVTVIEGDTIGGTCLNWGCIPSKVMKTTAELMNHLQRAKEFGLRLNGSVALDMEALTARKHDVVQNQIKGLLNLFEHHRIQYVRGFGTIRAMNVCTVRLADGKTMDLPWDRLILAPGSAHDRIPSLPFDGARILSSNDALSLQAIPGSLLIVGGGVIGCEFAFIFACLGSKVTVVEAMPRVLPLPSVDEDCSKVIQREMKKRRIELLVNRTVDTVEEREGRCVITLGPSPFVEEARGLDKEPIAVVADKVLVCVGRKPNMAGMGIERVGVKTDEKGWIIADRETRTTVPHIYAIGDALGPSRRPMLAYVASAEGLVSAENAVGGKQEVAYDTTPIVVFTIPEVANVGLSEAQARDQGYKVRCETLLFRNLGKPHVIGEIAGQAKIVFEAEGGRILGIHLVGPHASDLIAEGTLALKMGCTVRNLAETIHGHPTLAEIMSEVSLKALGRSIHG
jgi:dihydrolipoamide dehydrogenase